MSVSFRVKDQSKEASHNAVYSGVAKAAVQPAVGVRGGVTGVTGQGLALRTDDIRGIKSPKLEGGGVGMNWLVMLSQLNFFSHCPVKETSFCGLCFGFV